MKAFISGSMSITEFDINIIQGLKHIVKYNHGVLVGDAVGVDKQIQLFFSNTENEVTVYGIYNKPRVLISNRYKYKRIVTDSTLTARKRQMQKDAAMTRDADYLFVIWDGKSYGSYSNIIRGLQLNKIVIVYLQN
ncbi:MAG: hypothetical protein B6I31_03830, partial [Desulfobacteraceae bacterium 4572_19]